VNLRINICQIILLLLNSYAWGQSELLHYNVNNGLSQNSITCIFRDKQGIVWIGTQDGLNRFDGYRFRVYKHDARDTNSISDQFVLSIQEDGGNNLIVGTRNGLNLFDKRKEIFYNISPEKEKLKTIQYHFTRIESLANGNLIISGPTDLYEWNWQTKKISRRKNYIQPGIHFSVYQNQYLQIDHALHVFSSNQHLDTALKDSLSYTESIKRFNQYTDRQGVIWLTERTNEENTKISLYDAKINQWFKKNILIPGVVQHIYFDNKNQAWVSTNQGILFSSNQQNFMPLDVNGDVIKGEVHCSYTDEEGLTWIGFNNNGIALYNPEIKAYHLYGSNINHDPAYAAITFPNGDIWMASSSGLYVFDKTKRRKKLRNEYCTALAKDNNHHIWVGTKNSGILVLDKNGNKINEWTTRNSTLATNQIFHLQFDTIHKRIFAATPNGLLIYALKNKQSYLFRREENRIAGNYVLHSFTDSKGNIWASSNTGVDLYDANLKNVLRLESDNDSNQIKKTIISACSEDKTGNIWIATLSNGIYRYNGKTLKQFHSGNGLSSNYCYGVACDEKGRIWITTTSGINIIDPSSNKIMQLTEQNGLPTIDYSIGSLHIDENNKLYTGSPDGIIEINSSLVSARDKFFKPFISNVSINYQPAEIKSDYRLHADEHQISFEFVAPCYINAGKLIYQYRIVGINNEWITVQSDNRVIHLIELPFKPVQVEIRSAFNKALLPNAPVTTIHIYRQPPLWRNPIIIFLEIVLLIAVLAWLIRFILKKRLDKKIKEVEMMESIYKERERISRDLHDHLGAYAAAIKSNIVQAEKETTENKTPFIQLKENAEGMVSSLRETIWALQHEHISITAISDRFKNHVNRLSVNYPDVDIDITENIINNIELSPSESIQLVRIMQEALTNALKHANSNRINIHIESTTHLMITISDNGKGFDQGADINGYGIRNMKERAKEAGFDLTIQSSTSGTMLSIIK
jgi:signal transduction histidine kinase/ligand-binding sensor domain-containing protein